MDLILETDRLLLRKIQLEDAQSLFEMDNNPNVHQYLGNHFVTSIDEVYQYIDKMIPKFIKREINA